MISVALCRRSSVRREKKSAREGGAGTSSLYLSSHHYPLSSMNVSSSSRASQESRLAVQGSCAGSKQEKREALR